MGRSEAESRLRHAHHRDIRDQQDHVCPGKHLAAQAIRRAFQPGQHGLGADGSDRADAQRIACGKEVFMGDRQPSLQAGFVRAASAGGDRSDLHSGNAGVL